MKQIDCPEELELPFVPGTANFWGKQMIERYGKLVVGLSRHYFPSVLLIESPQRSAEIRYDVVEAFLNHGERETDYWHKSPGHMKDRPRLENAFYITAERLSLSIRRIKQACTTAYKTDGTKNRPEQFLEDLLQIEFCYKKMKG